jgi:hypothetical protein
MTPADKDSKVLWRTKMPALAVDKEGGVKCVQLTSNGRETPGGNGSGTLKTSLAFGFLSLSSFSYFPFSRCRLHQRLFWLLLLSRLSFSPTSSSASACTCLRLRALVEPSPLPRPLNGTIATVAASSSPLFSRKSPTTSSPSAISPSRVFSSPLFAKMKKRWMLHL